MLDDQLERRRAQSRAYKARNREKIREYNREYKRKNAVALSAYNKEYRLENRETVYEWNRRWAADNPEKIKAVKDRWLERNPERREEAVRSYRAKNKEKCYLASKISQSRKPWKYRENVASRRAKRRLSEPSWVDRTEIQVIYEQASLLDMTVDHIIPLQHPLVCGLHVPWNLQLLTASENYSKGNKFEPFTTNAATDA